MSNQDFDPDAFLSDSAAPAPAPKEGFDPTAYLAQPEGFNPDAYLGAPKKEVSRLDELGKTVTDIPHQTWEDAATAASTVNETFNPFSEGVQKKMEARIKDAQERPWYDIRPGVSSVLETGKGLLALPMVPGAIISGPGRSVLGHGYSAVTGDPYKPEDMTEEGRKRGAISGQEAADKAMLGLAPGRGGLRTAVRPPVAPVPPVDGPFGVTLTQGEEAADFAKRAAEQRLIRTGDPHASRFLEQRQEQLTQAPLEAAPQLDAAGRVEAGSSVQAADRVANALDQHQSTINQRLQNNERLLAGAHEDIRNRLSPTNTPLASTPLEAADIVSGSVAASAERAQAAADAAYGAFRDLPGQFHPASFNKTADVIRNTLARGEDPTFINPQNTPNASRALDDLTEILGDISQIRDPETGRIIPRPPVTPQLVETARKRLNTSLSNALSSARSTGNWADVRAMRQVIDEFDGQVLKKLDTTFTGGDPRDVSSALKWARGQYAEYRKTFTPQGAGDVVGPAIQKIVGRYEGQAATPEEIQSMLYGKGSLPVKVGRRLIDIFGANSPEVGAVKQGLYSYITERPPGATAWGPEQVANRIASFTEGPGRTLTQTYLSPQEIGRLKTLEGALRQHAKTVEGAVNPFEGADWQAIFRQTVNGSQKAVGQVNEALTRLGPTSPEASTLRQGLFFNALQPVVGVEKWGVKQKADNLANLLQATRNSNVYTRENRQVIQAYIDMLRKLEVPKGVYEPSGPAVDRLKMGIERGIGQMIGYAIARHLPGTGLAMDLMGIKLGGEGASFLARKNVNKVRAQLPLVAEQVQKYQKALAIYNKSQNPLSTAAVTFAGTNLTRSLAPLGIDLGRMPQLQLPGISGAEPEPEPPKTPNRAAGGGAQLLEDEVPGSGSLFDYFSPTTGDLNYPEGRPPGNQPSNALETPAEAVSKPVASSAAPEGDTPLQAPLEHDPSQIGQDTSIPTPDRSSGMPAVDKLLGLGGQERYQLWPEKLVRSALTLPGDVVSGKVASAPGLRREDITDIPAPGVDAEREGGFPGFRNFLRPYAAGPNDELIERTQDLAGIMGGTGFATAKEGALGTAGGKLSQSIKDALHNYVSDDVYKNSMAINYHLREPGAMEESLATFAAGEIPKIDQAFAQVGIPLEKDTYFWRMAPRGVYDKAGVDTGYTHVTRSKRIAEEMRDQHGEENAAHLYKIKVPKGTPIIETDPYLDPKFSPMESGVLLPRGGKLEPTKEGFVEYTPPTLLSDTSKPAAPLSALAKQQPHFYSAVEQAITNAPQQKMHASQWAGWLKNQPGVKAEELSHLGLDKPDTLPFKGVMTKDQMLAHARENGVQLGEVEKGSTPVYTPGELKLMRDAGITDPENATMGQLGELPTELSNRVFDNIRRGTETKFSDYQLPGGENYRELVLTLPNQPKVKNITGDENSFLAYARDQRVRNRELTPNEIAKEEEILGRSRAYQNALTKADVGAFRSSHWDEPNPVGHLRMNDREIPGVGKSMHLEEVQSDWAQTGRKKGFTDPVIEARIAKLAETRKELVSKYGKGAVDQALLDRFPENTQAAKELRSWVDEADSLRGLPSASGNTVPSMPFKQSWPDLLLKRAITKAARENYDSISWTPGEQQAARYDLSKQVDQVQAIKNRDGTYQLAAMPKGSRNAIGLGSSITKEELANHIGKDLAEKVVAEVKDAPPPEPIKKGKQDFATGDRSTFGKEGYLVGDNNWFHTKAEAEDFASRRGYGEPKVFSGVDLKVGGEGMKAFYDKMLVDKANAIGKKYGAKVEWKELPGSGRFEGGVSGEMVMDKIGIPKADQSSYWKSLSQINRDHLIEHFRGQEPVKVPVLRLTPQLKEQALTKGMPLFSDSGKPGAALSALESASEPGKTVYHVTNTKNLQSIKKNGLIVGKPTNWIKQGTGEAYGKGHVYAFNNRDDAMRWAARMDWENNHTTGSGKVSIVRLKAEGKDKWKVDLSDPLSHLGSRGQWLKHSTNLPASRVIGAEPFSLEMGRELVRKNNANYPKVDEPRAFGGAVNAQPNQNQIPRPIAQQPHSDEPYEPQSRAAGGRVNPDNINHSPSEAQKEAGNYAKEHVNIHGLNITIENARGSKRKGVDADGKSWEVKMPCAYGYVKKTEGADQDHFDVFLGPHLKSNHVFLIDQIDADTGKFDEHKAILGAGSRTQALDLYQRAFSDGRGKARIGAVTEMTTQQFKGWLSHGDTKKPVGKLNSEKVDHKTVGYQAKSSHGTKRCATCSMFIGVSSGGPACTLVRLPISPFGYCTRYSNKF